MTELTSGGEHGAALAPRDEDGPPYVERRIHPRLRELFERAYDLVLPFFDPVNRWGDASLDHLAYRVLRENFPQLSSEEVEEVVLAAHRVYVTRHAPSGRHPFKR
jgi:hypothetical protein